MIFFPLEIDIKDCSEINRENFFYPHQDFPWDSKGQGFFKKIIKFVETWRFAWWRYILSDIFTFLKQFKIICYVTNPLNLELARVSHSVLLKLAKATLWWFWILLEYYQRSNAFWPRGSSSPNKDEYFIWSSRHTKLRTDLQNIFLINKLHLILKWKIYGTI